MPGTSPHRRGRRGRRLAVPAPYLLDRRQFLVRAGGAGLFVIAGPTLLAACGTGGGTGGGGGADALVVDNWILYIDCGTDADGGEDCGVNPTIDSFSAETGISVTYNDGGVNSNEEWFGKYQPQLAAGQSIGIDMVMLTDHYAARMIRLDYVEQLDKANIPNATNLVTGLQNKDFDPNRDYTLPWQSFFTSVGYDIDQTGREITSLQELLDPAFAGKVGILEGYDDTLTNWLLMDGKNPETASVEEYLAAADQVGEAVQSGQIRDVYGNDYIDALLLGDLAITLAYSGDVVASQADAPNVRFAFPEEGVRIGTDNMMILKGAANKAGAEAWMDFYYRPDIAAKLAAYTLYMTPVEGVQEAIKEIDPALAEEPLIFPSDEVLAKAYAVRSFTEEEEAAVANAYAAAVGL